MVRNNTFYLFIYNRVAEYGRVSVSIELLNNKLIGASATDEIYTSFPINGYVKADLARKSFSGALLTSHVGSYNKPQYSVIHRVVPKLYYIETNPNTGKLEIIKDHVFQEGGPQVLVGSDLIYVRN